jgi:hypothetical protein
MMGRPIFRFIPMKVPLGARFNPVLLPKDRFTVEDAMRMAQETVNGITFDVPGPPNPGESEPQVDKVPATVNMVVDLTNSSRYYNLETFEKAGYRYVKVRVVKIHFKFIISTL